MAGTKAGARKAAVTKKGKLAFDNLIPASARRAIARHLQVNANPPVTPVVAAAIVLKAAAERAVEIMQEAIANGSVRLPCPGYLEALVDLKRAIAMAPKTEPPAPC